MNPEEPPQSLCILRLSAIGDVSHTVPVVRTLRNHWPDTAITWIVGRTEARLVGDLEGVEFIVFDKRGGWSSIRKLHRKLGGRRFDILLQMQTAARANLLSLLVRADRKIGWNRARSRDRHHWFVGESVADVPLQHQAEGFLEFPRHLGIPVESPRWDIPVSESDHAWVTDQLPGMAPVLVISPCSSHPLRNWSAERYARVADMAASDHRMQVVLAGGPSELEKEMGARIASIMSHTPVNLIGRDTLKQSLALYQRADLVISPDSAPAHLASSVNTPVIGLYAATWSKRSGPYHSLDITVDRFAEAARKYRNREPEDLLWGTRIEEPGVMELIEVDDVIEKLEQVKTAPKRGLLS